MEQFFWLINTIDYIKWIVFALLTFTAWYKLYKIFSFDKLSREYRWKNYRKLLWKIHEAFDTKYSEEELKKENEFYMNNPANIESSKHFLSLNIIFNIWMRSILIFFILGTVFLFCYVLYPEETMNNWIVKILRDAINYLSKY